MTEHIPVPYGYFKSQESRFFQAEKWAITGPDHDHEESWDIVADGIPDEATARFIVTACNNYENTLAALSDIRDLARTGLPISSMTQERYNAHRLNTIAGLSAKAIRKAEESAK